MIPGSKGLKPPVLAQRAFLKNGRIWFNDSPAFLIYLSFLSLCFCVFPIDSTAVFWQQDSHLHSDNMDIDNADLSSDGCNHPHPYSYRRDNTHIPRHKYNKCMFHSWFLTLYSIFSLHFPSVARCLQHCILLLFVLCTAGNSFLSIIPCFHRLRPLLFLQFSAPNSWALTNIIILKI